jgi:hypothetical protein
VLWAFRRHAVFGSAKAYDATAPAVNKAPTDTVPSCWRWPTERALVISALVFEAENPLEHSVFREIFGQIMTLLIALEFNYTLRYVVSWHASHSMRRGCPQRRADLNERAS